MKLSDCRIGVVVQPKTDASNMRIGHIVGLDFNNSGEVVPTVLWAGDKYPTVMHNRNIEEYKG